MTNAGSSPASLTDSEPSESVTMLEATLSEPEKADEMAARLPDRVPFGTNSGWLALCLNRDVSPPTVVLVRRDENAIVDLVRGPRL